MIFYVHKETRRITGGTWGDSPDSLAGITKIPDGCEALYLDNKKFPTVIENQGSYIIQPDGLPVYSAPEPPSVDERRAEVTAKWDPLIAAKREKVRQLQDEDKASVAITKAKTDLKTAITDRNLELGGIV